jgi:hypothetical protein
MPEVTLEFIGKQLERLLVEVANNRDELIVNTAICTRLEGAIETIIVELRATRRRSGREDSRLDERIGELREVIARLADRIAKLENAS